ncbi:MAG: hypothetical protein H7257_09170 [Taibaiella sp.]|nr:hypothetical protein [Taibaiella sp.]
MIKYLFIVLVSVGFGCTSFRHSTTEPEKEKKAHQKLEGLSINSMNIGKG